MEFTLPVRVYWEDTDAGGIVYYANYLKYFERARTEWLRQKGIRQQALRDSTGGMFVVREASVRYHFPAVLDDLLSVTTSIVECGRASMTLAQRALRKSEQGDTLLCDATIRIGWVERSRDAATLRPARIPLEVMGVLK